MIKNHVLLRHARDLEALDDTLAAALGEDVVETIVSWIPEGWLKASEPGRDPGDVRAAYARYLADRLLRPRLFAEEAIGAR